MTGRPSAQLRAEVPVSSGVPLSPRRAPRGRAARRSRRPSGGRGDSGAASRYRVPRLRRIGRESPRRARGLPPWGTRERGSSRRRPQSERLAETLRNVRSSAGDQGSAQDPPVPDDAVVRLGDRRCRGLCPGAARARSAFGRLPESCPRLGVPKADKGSWVDRRPWNPATPGCPSARRGPAAMASMVTAFVSIPEGRFWDGLGAARRIERGMTGDGQLAPTLLAPGGGAIGGKGGDLVPHLWR